MSDRPGAENHERQVPRAAVSWENPFGDRGCIRDPSRFFGRQEQLRRIFEELRKGSSLSLVGDSQVGKSSLLAMVRHQAAAELGALSAQVVHVDMQMIRNEAEFFEALCVEMGLPGSLRSYKLARALQGRRYVVCLDEIEKMANRQNFTGGEREELRGLADGADAPLTLVIASRSPLDVLFEDDPMRCSPLAGICGALPIVPFSWAETQAFLCHRLLGNGIQFSLEQMEVLFHQTQGHPARLQAAADTLYRNLS
ncbi:MAG: hypothetical protein EA367_05335 [Leptolyngbya sp. DLM2.Bin15]|nr:MAG: hypothetical protein EA367_05335 [Leptolyngbya sp. DLM2.Bin15]